jgi:hypothetical protein
MEATAEIPQSREIVSIDAEKREMEAVGEFRQQAEKRAMQSSGEIRHTVRCAICAPGEKPRSLA